MADPKRGHSDRQLLARFWPYARPYRGLILGAALSIPLVSLLGLAPPLLLMNGIDVNLLGKDPHPYLALVLNTLGLDQAMHEGLGGLWATCILFWMAVILEYVFRSLQLFSLQFAGQRSVGRLREALYKHVSSQAARFFDQRPTGALLTRTTSDIEALGDSLSMGVVTILADVFNMLAITTFMLLLSVKLTLVSFAIAPLLVLVVNFFRGRLKETFIRVRKTLAAVNAYLQEQLSGVRVVQLFNREEFSYSSFKSRNIKNLRAFQLSNVYDASLYAIMDGMASLCVAAMLWYGGLSIAEGILTLGMLVAFVEYIQRLFVPIKEFSAKFAVLQQAVASMDRVVDLLDQGDEIGKGTQKIERASGAIQLEDVHFCYTEKGGDVLSGISFDVKPGQVVALVGATGSGKTTVGKLLTRMYDGYRGRICFDGIELRDITPESIRAQIGVVQQDVVLFDGSIEFNVSLGREEVSRERVIEASRLVQAEEFIRALPEGFDFHVAERGANLSAGQAQLLAFARVMAYDPPIVLLDEATASIDSRTEAAIQKATELIFEKKTVLVIAHRLSTIQAADHILVMRGGQIVEAGSHQELLHAGGYYATLYRHGFSEELPEVGSEVA